MDSLREGRGARRGIRNVWVDKIQTPAIRNVCVDKIRTGGLPELGIGPPTSAEHAPTPTHPPTYTIRAIDIKTPILSLLGKHKLLLFLLIILFYFLFQTERPRVRGAFPVGSIPEKV